jgi:hypothetical protein
VRASQYGATSSYFEVAALLCEFCDEVVMRAIRNCLDMWPVVFWVFDGVQTDEDVEFYLSTLNMLHSRKEPFVTISLMRKFQSNRQHLSRVAEWIKRDQASGVTYNIAAAMISTSPLFRFALSSLFLIQPLQTPYRVFAEQSLGLEWVSGVLRERKLKVPDGLARFVV